MVKFTATDESGRILIGLGLSRGNVRLLTEGKPIVVRLADLDRRLTGEVMIFFGETEREMYDDMCAKGLIDPQTRIIGTPSVPPGEQG